jgi:tRNA dimethylallyltransferase
MNSKLLVICGPTSTGKTILAISLAKKFNGEIVSADSRQVYKGLDIGTGKDLPKNAKIKYLWMKKFGFYEIKGIKIWGYDLADPRHSFSVSQYLRFAERVISDISKRGKLPILVGGTGLYIKGVVDGIPTAEIPKNKK